MVHACPHLYKLSTQPWKRRKYAAARAEGHFSGAECWRNVVACIPMMKMPHQAWMECSQPGLASEGSVVPTKSPLARPNPPPRVHSQERSSETVSVCFQGAWRAHQREKGGQKARIWLGRTLESHATSPGSLWGARRCPPAPTALPTLKTCRALLAPLLFSPRAWPSPLPCRRSLHKRIEPCQNSVGR